MKVIEFENEALEFAGFYLLDSVYSSVHSLGERRYLVPDEAIRHLQNFKVPFIVVGGQENAA